jgi:predicted anti-sigma-YlaC factor YlaD
VKAANIRPTVTREDLEQAIVRYRRARRVMALWQAVAYLTVAVAFIVGLIVFSRSEAGQRAYAYVDGSAQ